MMQNTIKRISIGLSIAIITILSVLASISPVYAGVSDFQGLTGQPRSGKVRIAVSSSHEQNGKTVTLPNTIKIAAGDDTSYIPWIQNLGEKCNLRIKVHANAGNDTINILNYAYGWEDQWVAKDGWFYYKKPFEKKEKVQLCEGFHFPKEWNWHKNNKLNVTVDAEAVADEDMPTGTYPNTGDTMKLMPYLASTFGAAFLLYIVIRRKGKGLKHGSQDL